MDFAIVIILFSTIITSVSLAQWYAMRGQALSLTAEISPLKDKNTALEVTNANLQQKYMDAQTYIEKHISNNAIRAKYVFDKTTGLSNSIGDDHLFCTSKSCLQFYSKPSEPTPVFIGD